MAGPEPGLTVKVNVALWLGAPVPTPCTVTVYVPADRVLVPFKVTTLDPVGVTGLVPNDTVVPVGSVEVVDKVTGLLYPPAELTGSVTLMLAGAGQVAVAAVVDPKMNPKGGGMMVMLALLISMYTLPTAFTFTRTVVEGVLGTEMASVPSLGVLPNNKLKVLPPSVEI